MTRQVRVVPLDEIPEIGNRAFDVEGISILLCRSKAGLFAVENMCSHAMSPLEGGKTRGVHLFCPLHGVRFDLRDGTPSGTLTNKPVKIFQATVEDGIVFVALED